MSGKSDTTPVRLRDVAEAAGVNPSIASRILNDDPTLSARPETRRRVRAAAQRLGYIPNAFARGLKLQRTNTLGLVIPDVANAANVQLVQTAERTAAQRGYVLLLADMDDFAGSGDAYRRLILERRVDGLIVAGAIRGHRLGRDLASHRMPYVLVGSRPTPGAVCVRVDDAAGAMLAVDHLVGLGHRAIGHIAGPQARDASRESMKAYRAALDRHGLTGGAVGEFDVTEEGGYRGAEAVLAGRTRPTAIVVAGVVQTVGAMAAIRRAGLSVPGDVSLVALQDAPVAEYLDPPLTAVRMPLREVAETAVDRIIALIAGREAKDVTVPTQPELVIRGSSESPAVR